MKNRPKIGPVTRIYVGTVNEYGEVLETPRVGKIPKDSLLIRYIFHQYKKKKVKITIEELGK